MKRKLLITGLVLGGLLMLAPAAGLLATVFGMQRAFQTLSGSGISNPQELSENIGSVLTSTAAGFLLGVCGLILVCACGLILLLSPKAPPPLPPPDP